uniref:glycerol kinase n=2 Tax=Chaetoceros debilis TaxID=122233 RepID=A0A7S3Q1G0_9STRA
MQAEEIFIGLDVGTQSTKAVLYHPSSQSIKARAGSLYDLDESSNPSRKEQHPHKWIRALHICLKELSKIIEREGYAVRGIGVSGQQHGMVLTDENFHVLRSAKLWCDVEASAEAKEFSEKATKAMKNIVGEDCVWSIPAGFTAPKVLWVKKNEPELFEKVRWVMLPHDYVNLCLKTGVGYNMKMNEKVEDYKPDDDESFRLEMPTTDAGDASGTGLLHPSKPEYVPELAAIIDSRYEAYLPKIQGPNEVSGYLSANWKKATGIDPDNLIDIPISVGSGDNMMSALGSKLRPGNAVMSLGTSGTIFGVSDTPVQTGTPVAAFNDATGNYLPLACVMSCTGVLNQVLEHWCSIPGKSEVSLSHLEASKLAASVPPGCHGLTFLPYLGGERTPDWPMATGALLGVTPNNMCCMAGGSPGIMYRAAMEGISYLMADALDQMRQSCGDGFKPKSLMVVGGGSKNHLWRQMLADVLQLDLRFPLEPETAALGAAFQAGAAATSTKVNLYVSKQNVEIEEGIVTPSKDADIIQSYHDGFQRYMKYSRQLNS